MRQILRSLLISIPSTTSDCRTSCNMTKTLLFIFLGLVAVALSENLGEDQGNEIEETFEETELDNFEELQEDEDENLEESRVKRDADPKKKRKVKGKKSRKTGRKGKKIGRKNAKKGARKNKGKAKKGGKKARKFGRKNNKAGKQRKTKRKQTKRGKKPRKSGSVQQGGSVRLACSRAVNSTCLDTAVKLLKIVQQKVTNFLVQQKRMSKFNSTGEKKSAKKGLFGPIASKVIDVGGGNASDLSCSGNKTNPGATKLKSIISDLQKCEKSIMVACDTSAYPLPNITEAMEGKTNMESMKKSVEACAKKTGEEACTCWMDSTLMATAEKVKKCDFLVLLR